MKVAGAGCSRPPSRKRCSVRWVPPARESEQLMRTFELQSKLQMAELAAEEQRMALEERRMVHKERMMEQQLERLRMLQMAGHRGQHYS